MTTLHLIRTSDFTSTQFNSALNVLNQNDALVLLDDGCYNIHHTLMQNNITKRLINEQCFYIIGEHRTARAIKVNDFIQEIPLSQLVELSFQYNKVMTWQ